MKSEVDLSEIWNGSPTATAVNANETTIVNENHSAIFDKYWSTFSSRFTSAFSNALIQKIEEFILERFTWKGLPEESIIFKPNGALESGIVEPNFKYAMESRLSKNGYSFIIPYGAYYYVVNGVPSKWDKDMNALEIQVVEPFSPILNGLRFTNKKFVEFRNNWSKTGLLTKIQPSIAMINEIWELMIEEINLMINKKLYNINVIKDTALNRVAIDNITKSKKGMVGLDMTGTIDALDEKVEPFVDVVFESITDRLIMKMDYNIKIMYQNIGMPINASGDKKGANLTEDEVHMENLVSGALITHSLNMRKASLDRLKKLYPEFASTEVEITPIQDFNIWKVMDEVKEEVKSKLKEGDKDE